MINRHGVAQVLVEPMACKNLSYYGMETYDQWIQMERQGEEGTKVVDVYNKLNPELRDELQTGDYCLQDIHGNLWVRVQRITLAEIEE